MQNTENVTVGDNKIVVVREVKVKRILAALPFGTAKEDENDAETGFMAKIEDLLLESTGLTQDDLTELHGSEIEQLWEAFRKVNSFFFKIMANKLLEKPIQGMLDTVGPACGEMFVDLLKEDTETA